MCLYCFNDCYTGIIKKIGPYEKLFFGSKSTADSQVTALQSIFERAKIESYLVENIEETVWEKFIFISALALATSYLNQNIGQILSNSESKQVYLSLLNEITLIASAKGLKIPDNIIEMTIIKLEKSPQEATSSMHRDFLANHKTEVVSLTEFVVKEGIKYGVSTPVYQTILKKLLK